MMGANQDLFNVVNQIEIEESQHFDPSDDPLYKKKSDQLSSVKQSAQELS